MSDLRNQTPSTTYKGLLQVNDYSNGVDATSKFVQDGEGTDSALSVSTTKVGVGTASPSEVLDVVGNIEIANGNLKLNTSDRTVDRTIEYTNSGSSTALSAINLGTSGTTNYLGHIAFKTKGVGDVFDDPLTEAMRINSDGNVGIGSQNPGAPLEVASTTGGVIMPRMNTTQRTAISSPTPGEMVYDTDLNKFYGYTSSGWTALH